MTSFNFLKFPHEHGLTAIWIASVCLGIGFAFFEEIQIVGILLALLFSVFAFFSSDSIIESVKRSDLNFFPIILIIGITVLIILLKPIFELFLILGVLIVVTIFWVILSSQSRQRPPLELLIGTVALALLAPFVYVISSSTYENFTKILGISWIFISVTVLFIIYVESLRGKVKFTTPLVIWLIFLISFLPLLFAQIISPFTLLAVIEPTLLAIIQVWRKELLKVSKRPIKYVGFQLVIRLTLFVILILITSFIL
jgi:hypothetical protein